MELLANIVLLIIGIPALIACAYLLLLTLLSAGVPVPKPTVARTLKFDVIVPAHNESAVIARTLNSMKKIEWPRECFRVLVVADNCTDNTADIVRAHGAEALERNDTSLRGKGYALKHAFGISAERQWADAVVVVDADAEVSANILESIAARIERGAQAVQVHYGILNPDAAWRTRLITIAKASFHIVRSRARERLNVSCGIRGNGWSVTHTLLRTVPYAAFSLTEDVEYGINIGMAGYRVYYADEAHSDAEMVSTTQAANQQRQRWEQGRFQLISSRTWPLLKQAFSQPSRICFDLAMDLLVLPLSYVAINVVLLILAAALASTFLSVTMFWLHAGLACAVVLALYVLRGWQLSGTGMQGLLDLCRAPVFLFWKLLLMLKQKKTAAWVRTEREKM